MQNRNKSNGGSGLFTFLLGVAAGAAAGYYLSTEEGRRMRERLAERSSAWAEEAQNYAKQTSERVNSSINTAMEQGRSYVDDLSKEVRTRVDQFSTQAREQVDRTQSAFQEGVARGKAKIDEQKAEIDNLVKNGDAGNSSTPNGRNS